MHHIYHTEGIILGSKSFGEASKYYYIFTKDLGMIRTSAQGVRKMSSKLRYILQDFSHVKIDLVRGRDFWRLTSASKTDELEEISKRRETISVFSNVAKLLRRLLAGEEPNENLFKDVVNGLRILEKSKAIEEIRNIEAILVLRILNNLGYIGGNESLDTLIKSPFEENLVFEASRSRGEVLKEINKALKETQL